MPMRKRKELFPLTPEERQLALDLVDSNYRLMLYMIRQFGVSADDEEDVLQDCIVNICRNIQKFQQMDYCKTRAYIVIIIRNLCIQRYISDRKAKLLSLDSDYLDDALIGIANERSAVDSDARLDVLELKDHLSERDKLLLLGKYVEGLTTEELAERLNCKPDSIRMLLSRAKKAAREILLHEEGGRSDRHG